MELFQIEMLTFLVYNNKSSLQKLAKHIAIATGVPSDREEFIAAYEDYDCSKVNAICSKAIKHVLNSDDFPGAMERYLQKFDIQETLRGKDFFEILDIVDTHRAKILQKLGERGIRE